MKAFATTQVSWVRLLMQNKIHIIFLHISPGNLKQTKDSPAHLPASLQNNQIDPSCNYWNDTNDYRTVCKITSYTLSQPFDVFIANLMLISTEVKKTFLYPMQF